MFCVACVQVTGVLNNIREQAGKLCMDTLHRYNSPLIMSQCGSKGSPINIAQVSQSKEVYLVSAPHQHITSE
jgi:hypothetical protein